MATIYELKRRAQELSAKKDSLSISPEEVSGLIDETLDVINEAEKNQIGLGIRNTYTTVAEMNADSTSPVGSDEKPLKFGQIVTVYDENTPMQSTMVTSTPFKIRGGNLSQRQATFPYMQKKKM